MRQIILFSLAVLATVSVSAQDSSRLSPRQQRKLEKRQTADAVARQAEEGVLVYTKQSVFGVHLSTNGYGLFYELGRIKSPRFTNLYTVELSEIKHPKEDRDNNAASGFFANSFIYGKINNLYNLKFSFGQQYILGQKGNKNGIAVLAVYKGGLNVGLLKPYYIQAQDSTGKVVDVSYESNPNLFLGESILSSAGVGKGLGEIKVRPGAFVQGALRFDFGRFNESVQAVQIGISIDAFPQKISIMAPRDIDGNTSRNIKPQNLFVGAHLAFVFGSRR